MVCTLVLRLIHLKPWAFIRGSTGFGCEVEPLQFLISVYFCLEIACHRYMHLATIILYKYVVVVKFVSLSLLDCRVNPQKVKRIC